MEARKLVVKGRVGLAAHAEPVPHGIVVQLTNTLVDGAKVAEILLPIPMLMALIEDAQEYTRRHCDGDGLPV